MTDHMARLKALISKTPLPTLPEKPRKAPADPFLGFQGTPGIGVLNFNLAKQQRPDPAQDPFQGFQGTPRRRVLKNEGLNSRPGVPQEWVSGFGSLSREEPLPGFSEDRWSML